MADRNGVRASLGKPVLLLRDRFHSVVGMCRHLVGARTSLLELLVGIGDLMYMELIQMIRVFSLGSLLASSAAASVEEWVEVVQEDVRGCYIKGPCNTVPGVSPGCCRY